MHEKKIRILANLYNNVIIYEINKVVRTVLFENEFTEFSYSYNKVRQTTIETIETKEVARIAGYAIRAFKKK